MENNAAKRRKIIKDGEDITVDVNEKHTMVRDYQPSSSKSDKRIEFNVQDPVQKFIGREEFLKTLHENISKSQLNENSKIRSNLIVICGMPGVGKTQVARKYIQTYKDLYGHVIWINAEKQSVATSCFLRLAEKIQIDVKHDGRQKFEEDILDEVYDFICQKRALFVYDNAGSYRTEDGKDNLHTLLPQNVKTVWTVPSIIVTTRNRKWPDFMVQELKGFELSTSLEFLAELKTENSTENQKLLHEIAELYQGLPLVLQQVLHYVRRQKERRVALEESYTLSDFLSEISLNRKKIMSTKPADLAHLDVYSLFDMTFTDLATMNYGKNALQCLDIMVLLNPDFISTVLLKYIFGNYKKELANGLKLLHDYNLVTQAKYHYQIHRVVQAARIDSNNAKLLLDGISEKCETSLQNVTLCCKGKQIELTFEEILNSICELISDTKVNSENNYEMFNNIVQLHDQVLGNTSEEFQKFQNILADKLYNAGNYSLASKVLETVVEMKNKTTCPTNLVNTNAKYLLSNIRYNKVKFEAGQNLYNRTLDKKIDILGPEHPHTLSVENSLGVVYICICICIFFYYVCE